MGRARRGWAGEAIAGRMLGLLWIVDGALKFQPGLADRARQAYSFAMTAMGTPPVLARLIVRVGTLLTTHPELWWGIGIVELLLGATLISGRARRPVLAAAVVWSLCIWVIGEGFEGLSAGATSVVTGFPGAALLYAVIAALLWPAVAGAGSLFGGGRVRRLAGKGVWSLLWLAGVAVQLRRPIGPGALDSVLFLQSQDEPGPLSWLDRRVASWLSYEHLVYLSVGLAATFTCLGVLVWFDAALRPVLAAAIGVNVVFWVVGQNLGGIFSGDATDIGTAPLFVLLAALLWSPAREPQPGRAGPVGVVGAAAAAAGTAVNPDGAARQGAEVDGFGAGL